MHHTDASIREAVAAAVDPTGTEAGYGHISAWDTSGVTDMAQLFADASSFNEDIGAWDISGVTSFRDMFKGALAFNQTLGWCLEDMEDADIDVNTFKDTPCESTAMRRGRARRGLLSADAAPDAGAAQRRSDGASDDGRDGRADPRAVDRRAGSRAHVFAGAVTGARKSDAAADARAFSSAYHGADDAGPDADPDGRPDHFVGDARGHRRD